MKIRTRFTVLLFFQFICLNLSLSCARSYTPESSPSAPPQSPFAPQSPLPGSPLPAPASPVPIATTPISSPGPASSPTTPAVPFGPSHRGKIDTHCHFVPPWYKELLNSRNLDAGGAAIPTWNVSAHLQLNALVGIETSVVSISTPGAKLSEDAPIEEGRQLARALNEYGKNLTEEYPNQFLYFAVLTLPDLEGAVAEAIYALDNLKAAGIIVEANTFGELFGTRKYDPLYKELNDRHSTVFIHPSESPCPDDDDAANDTSGLPPYVVDFLLDTTRAALNLVYRNVTTDYPNITFILAHSGGFLPFAATRSAGGLSRLLNRNLQSYFYAALKTFYVDLALSATTTALPSTTAYFGTGHITFGSDFPFAPVEGVVQNTDTYQSFPFSTINAATLTSKSNTTGISLGTGFSYTPGEGNDLYTKTGQSSASGLNAEAMTRINYGNAYALFSRFLT